MLSSPSAPGNFGQTQGKTGMFSLFFIVNYLTSAEYSIHVIRFIVWASGDPQSDQSVTVALVQINLCPRHNLNVDSSDKIDLRVFLA